MTTATELPTSIPLNVFQHRDLYVETSLSQNESGVFVVSNKLDPDGKPIGIYRIEQVKYAFEIFVAVATAIDKLILDARAKEDRPRYEQHDTQAWRNIKSGLIQNRLD